MIGMAISMGVATLGELSTVLGVEDLHDLLEVARVDAHNERVINKIREKGQ